MWKNAQGMKMLRPDKIQAWEAQVPALAEGVLGTDSFYEMDSQFSLREQSLLSNCSLVANYTSKNIQVSQLEFDGFLKGG